MFACYEVILGNLTLDSLAVCLAIAHQWFKVSTVEANLTAKLLSLSSNMVHSVLRNGINGILRNGILGTDASFSKPNPSYFSQSLSELLLLLRLIMRLPSCKSLIDFLTDYWPFLTDLQKQ